MTARINFVGAVLALFMSINLLIAAPASADVTLDLGKNSLVGGTFNTYQYTLTGDVTDFAISFNYIDGSSSADASDMILEIISPFQEHGYWGGFNVAPPQAVNMGFWSFFGNQSTTSGFYSDDSNPFHMNSTGLWTFKIWNGWNNGPVSQYNDVTLTLKGSIVPAPGALGLLGLAGLVGRRRSRLAA